MFMFKKSQLSTPRSTGLISNCGPDKFHFLSTENVQYTFHDFAMLYTNGN